MIPDSRFADLQISEYRLQVLIMAKTIERFEDLDVWKISVECANLIYDVTSTGKFSQDYVLRDQIRRAGVSIFSNIAEVLKETAIKNLQIF